MTRKPGFLRNLVSAGLGEQFAPIRGHVGESDSPCPSPPQDQQRGWPFFCPCLPTPWTLLNHRPPDSQPLPLPQGLAHDSFLSSPIPGLLSSLELPPTLIPANTIPNFNLFYSADWAPWVVLVVKNPAGSAGDIRDLGLIPGLGRSPGGGDGNPLHYSCLENPMDGGALQSMRSP